MAVKLTVPLEEVTIGDDVDDFLIVRYTQEDRYGYQVDGRISLQIYEGKLLIQWAGAKPKFEKMED